MATTSTIAHTSNLNKESLERIFRKHYKDPALVVESVEEDDSGVGFNSHFMSDITKKTVKLSTMEQPVKLIVKEPIQTSFQKVISKMMKPFMKETFWYMEAIPALKEFYPEIEDLSPTCFHAMSAYQDNYSQKWIDRQNIFCVMAFGKRDHGILVMEDLKDPARVGGPMKILDKTAIPDIEIAKLVMKNLAKFHGIFLSWMKNQEPKTIGGLDKGQFEATFSFKTMKLKAFFKDMLNMLKAAEKQSLLLGKSEGTIEAIKRFRKNGAVDKVIEMFGPLKEGKNTLQTLLHGDCWTSNFFVNEDLSKLAFIDFQAMTVQHPARDIWYYIYSCTDHEWRKKHVDECLDIYSASLQPYLQKAGVAMSPDDTKREIKEHQSFGIIFGMHIITLMLNPFEQSMDSNKAMKKFYKWRLGQFSELPKEGDHELLVEINRRFMEMIDEGFEIGAIRK